MKNNFGTKRIVLSGEGGQGIQTIATSLASAAMLSGYFVTYIPIFGVEQRGAPSIALVTISDKKIRYPRFEQSEICVILRGRAILGVKHYISPNTDVIFDSSTIRSSKLPKLATKKFGIPATKIASEKFAPKSYNVLVFGILCKMLEIGSEVGWKAVMKDLGAKFKNKDIEKKNNEAFLYGYEAVLEKNDFSQAEFETKEGENVYKNSERTGKVIPSLCKGCGICIEKCPVKALSFGEDLGVFAFPVPKIDIDKCIACGNCKRFCPDGAIAVKKNQAK